MKKLPGQGEDALALETLTKELAAEYGDARNFLYLGRGYQFPVALEGALKLKEVSYIHAEGYPAAEMKHAPIALIAEDMPVVAIVPRDGLRDKMLNNISEVKARGGTVIAVATEGDEEVANLVDHVLYIPQISPLLTPILATVPVHRLAYYIAVRTGFPVARPRNPATPVTRPAVSGAANAVTLPEKANRPKNSVVIPAGARRASSDLLDACMGPATRPSPTAKAR